MFHVGQKVVCVPNDMPWKKRINPNFKAATVGRVYTVRDTFVSNDGTPCLRLVEIVNEPVRVKGHAGLFEQGMRQARFRPVKTTSIAVFEQILRSVPAPRERVRV